MRNILGLTLLVLLSVGPVAFVLSASGANPQPDPCEKVLACLPDKPPPDCIDENVYYFACDRKYREIFDINAGRSYLCKTWNGETTRVRRNMFVNALDATVKARNMNREICS